MTALPPGIAEAIEALQIATTAYAYWDSKDNALIVHERRAALEAAISEALKIPPILLRAIADIDAEWTMQENMTDRERDDLAKRIGGEIVADAYLTQRRIGSQQLLVAMYRKMMGKEFDHD